MSVAQFYETTVVDDDLGLAARFVAVPGRFLPEKIDPIEPQGLIETLGFDQVVPIEPGWLVRGVASALAAESPAFLEYWPQRLDAVDNRHFRFAEYLTMARVVPFESSPLTAESIGNLITTTTGVGLGAFSGFVVAGSSPFIFVLVPAGMILFGAAAGVGRGLEEGLRDRIHRAIAPKSKRKR